jgi:hypothetical protein
VISLGKRYIARGGGTAGATAQPSNDVAHGQLSGAGIQVFLKLARWKQLAILKPCPWVSIENGQHLPRA